MRRQWTLQTIDIVSDIYECALDPGKWPSTMEVSRQNCHATSLIYTVDFERHSVKVVNECGHGSYWSERFLDWTEFILNSIAHC
ncbi:MAG: hypothetical protein IPL91_14855 [Hyphomicrobium sp.]|nr:hypothetical protein [Hyphomicrobium sp.]